MAEYSYLLSQTTSYDLHHIHDNENASRNNLTQYLHHIYDNEIPCKICDEDVSHIEKEVASIVQYIATYALERCKQDVQGMLYRFHEKMLKNCESEVIKVGSFYERTKNGFPDEFDFLFPIVTLEAGARYLNRASRLKFIYNNCFEDFHREIARFSENIDKKRKELPCNEWVVFKRLVERRGPSSKLEFFYKKCTDSAIETPLHVDLVPCFKINFVSQSNKYKDYFIRRSLLCKEFGRHVTLTNSFVLVGHTHPVSFTETEVRFMREVLSDKHRKVYRLLKFLLNGHGDNEALQTKFGQKGLCSYYIKCAIIYHHFKCRTENDNEEALCVLAVLRDLKCDLEKNRNRVTLLTHVKYVSERSTEALKELLGHLEEMQKSYKDRKLNIKSAAKTQYQSIEKERQKVIKQDVKSNFLYCCCVLPAELFCESCSESRQICCECLEICYGNCCECCEKCCEKCLESCIYNGYMSICLKSLPCICIGLIAVAGIIYFLIKFLDIIA